MFANDITTKRHRLKCLCLFFILEKMEKITNLLLLNVKNKCDNLKLTKNVKFCKKM